MKRYPLTRRWVGDPLPFEVWVSRTFEGRLWRLNYLMARLWMVPVRRLMRRVRRATS